MKLYIIKTELKNHKSSSYSIPSATIEKVYILTTEQNSLTIVTVGISNVENRTRLCITHKEI